MSSQKIIFVNLFCESLSLSGNKISGIAIHPRAIFHPEEPKEVATHWYLKEELQKAVEKTNPSNISYGFDHLRLLIKVNGLNIVSKLGWDSTVNGVTFEGFVDDSVADMIRQKRIRGVSIEVAAKPGLLIEFVEGGVVPYNFEIGRIDFLTMFPPGDPESYVKLWEALREQGGLTSVGPQEPLDVQIARLKDDVETRFQSIDLQIAEIKGTLSVITGKQPVAAAPSGAAPLTVLPESLRSNSHDFFMLHPEMRSSARPQPLSTPLPLNEAQRRQKEVREREKQEWDLKEQEWKRKTDEANRKREMENMSPADKLRKILGIKEETPQ